MHSWPLNLLKFSLQSINIFDLRAFLAANLGIPGKPISVDVLAYILKDETLASIGNGQAKKAIERHNARSIIGKAKTNAQYALEKKITSLEVFLRKVYHEQRPVYDSIISNAHKLTLEDVRSCMKGHPIYVVKDTKRVGFEREPRIMKLLTIDPIVQNGYKKISYLEYLTGLSSENKNAISDSKVVVVDKELYEKASNLHSNEQGRRLSEQHHPQY